MAIHMQDAPTYLRDWLPDFKISVSCCLTENMPATDSLGFLLRAKENEVLQLVSGNLLFLVMAMPKIKKMLQATFHSRCSES
jgi:hypothetical protein